VSSSLHRLREAIKTDLVTSTIWKEEEIIIARQTSIWNDIAVAVANSKNGVALVIGVAEGIAKGESRDSIPMDLTIPITTFCEIQLSPTAIPEEKLWEDTVKRLTGKVPTGTGLRQHANYRLRFKRFSDDVETADDVAHLLARQTIFEVSHIIK
jgi:hypothetical protein